MQHKGLMKAEYHIWIVLLTVNSEVGNIKTLFVFSPLKLLISLFPTELLFWLVTQSQSSTFSWQSTIISLTLTFCTSHSFWKHVHSDLQDIYTKLNIYFLSFYFPEICSDWLWPLVWSSFSTRLSAEGEMTCTKPQHLWCCEYPVWISFLWCAERTLKRNGCLVNLHKSNMLLYLFFFL